MMRTQVQSDSSTASRTGFSLVELLIVIGIIGLMVVLIVFAMGPSLQTARINATRTTIAKLHDIIQKRVDAIIRMDVSVEAKKLAGLNSGLSEKAAEFLIRQNLYKQALPQRPEDLTGLDGSSGGSDNAPLRDDWITAGGQATSPTSPVDRELNSELMLFALTQGGRLQVLPSGKSYTVPTLDIGQINPRHVQDTDGNGLNEFVDEWEQPLRFYSAPTRLIRSGGPNSMPPPALSPITATDLQRASVLISGLPNDTSDTGPNGRDPFDPTGTLSTTTFFASSFDLNYSKDPNNIIGTVNNCSAFGETEYHTPNTYYVPLIVSIGPDGQSGGANPLGLFEPTDISAAGRHLGMVDTANADGLTDNITNRQQ